MLRLILVLFFLTVHCANAHCWQQAGERYGIEPELLQAIATVESGLSATAFNKNRDGSTDVGLMQINSQHFKYLKKYRITPGSLLNNPCQNIMTGAWVLAGQMRIFGYSWEAVGAYNAGNARNKKTRLARMKYSQKVARVYQGLKSNDKD
ncbi:lytic transglycosylase domain-containing protein [Kosakonia sp. H02]|nr:lytic transglycosylase domain-containing protein [Kosakonia sp. H02]